MENQGKRLILAIALALGILLLWQYLFPPEKPKPKPEVSTDETAQVERQVESPVGVPAGATAPPVATDQPAEEVIRFEFDRFDAEFSNVGARLVSWKLTDPKWEGDWTKGEMVPSRELGQLGVNFYQSTQVIPEGAVWKGVKLDDRTVEYTYESDDLVVTKTFRIYPEDFLLQLTVSVRLPGGAEATAGAARAEATQRLAISMFGAQPPGVDTGGGMGRATRDFRAACYLGGEVKTVTAERLLEAGPDERAGQVRWAGFNHPYLFFAVAPKGDKETLGCHRYPVLPVEGGLQGGMRIDLVYQAARLVAGAPPMTKEVVAYIGPKYVTALENASEVAGFSTGFEDSVDMGWFAFIARPLLSLLQWIYGFVGNWGIAIILLTVLVKLATLYWTTKSMRSMKAMAALGPKLKELQAKYADDRQKLQQETMALYKANGVNPLAGCLPMLLQMPIWLALYRMLSAVGELHLAPFIPGWIDDLTATDPFYVLPIAVTAVMFLQSKLSPTSLDSMQQKILVYGLPLMFGVMSFFFPSGLSLYIFTNSLLSMLHTLYMRKFDKSKVVVPPVKPAASDVKPREQAKRRDAEAAKPAPKRAASPAPEERVDDEGDEGGEDEAEAEEPAARAVDKGPPANRAGAAGGRKTNTPRRKRKRGKH